MMKLNPDCIRDILISVEEATDGVNLFQYDIQEVTYKRMKKYEHNEIIYHIRQCKMADLIVGCQEFDAGDLVWIQDLSPKGHEFLANIRQDTIWNNTKEVAAKVGSKSLNTLLQISTSIITQLIKAQFGLT